MRHTEWVGLSEAVGRPEWLEDPRFQNTAGLGVDWRPGEKFSLSFEAYDFGREEDLDPHLRLIGRWRFHDNFFLQGGYDDFLEGDRDSIFFGGGIRWSDDDLKYLLGSVPVGSF